MNARSIIQEITNFSSEAVNSHKFAIVTSLLIYLALLPLKLVFVPNDHAGYLEFMSQAEGLSGLSDPEAKGKLWVALIYAYIDRVIPYQLLTSIVFIVYLYIVSRHACSWFAIIFHVILIAPLSPYFGYVTKEALLLMVMVFSYAVSAYRPKAALLGFYILIFLFSFFVRQYYIPFLILAFLIPRTDFRLLVIGGGGVIISILVFFNEVFSMLYHIKEDMWVRLRYDSVVNTLFPLDIPYYNSFIDVVYLWLQNLYYLTTAIFRNPGFSGAASLVSLIMVLLVFKGLWRKGVFDVYIFSLFCLLFMSYLVPDSGTFVRHSTLLSILAFFSVFIKLTPSSGVVGND